MIIADNFRRTLKRASGSTVLTHGTWGEMNLTNIVGRAVQSITSAVQDGLIRAASKNIDFYSAEGMWADKVMALLKLDLERQCGPITSKGELTQAEEPFRFGCGLVSAVTFNEFLSVDLKEFFESLLSRKSCDEGYDRMRLALEKNLVHGDAPPDSDNGRLLRGLVRLGLLNIDSGSAAGCLEILRLCLIHPILSEHFKRDTITLFGCDVKLFEDWMQGKISCQYPPEVSNKMVFLQDMWLHPLIRFNKLLWFHFGPLIKILFDYATGVMGTGKKQDSARLSMSRVWFSIIQTAFSGCKILQEKLFDMSISFASDAEVSALIMFFDTYVPLAVAMSECMDRAKSEDLATARNSFDILRRVLLPSMAFAFSTLGSDAYAQYCVFTVCQLHYWESDPDRWPLFHLLRDNPSIVNRVDIELDHGELTRKMHQLNLVEGDVAETTKCAAALPIVQDLDADELGAGKRGAELLGRTSSHGAAQSSKLDVSVSLVQVRIGLLLEEVANAATARQKANYSEAVSEAAKYSEAVSLLEKEAALQKDLEGQDDVTVAKVLGLLKKLKLEQEGRVASIRASTVQSIVADADAAAATPEAVAASSDSALKAVKDVRAQIIASGAGAAKDGADPAVSAADKGGGGGRGGRGGGGGMGSGTGGVKNGGKGGGQDATGSEASAAPALAAVAASDAGVAGKAPKPKVAKAPKTTLPTIWTRECRLLTMTQVSAKGSTKAAAFDGEVFPVLPKLLRPLPEVLAKLMAAPQKYRQR